MSKPLYLDPSASVDERVEDLLSRMTTDEKFAQITGRQSTEECDAMLDGERYPKDGVGAVLARRITPEMTDTIQKNAKEHSRLGIPPIVFEESLHGVMKENYTVFPQSVLMGSSFNEKLVYDCADMIGREAAASGIRQTLAPNIDLSRDPRWGRVEENYGEDPYLTARMGTAYVRGLQSNKVAATVKHFAAHGSPEGGVNISPVHVGEREWRETMIEPFATAVREGEVLSVMPAYSELDGIPLHANRKMLTDVLRGELNFDGYVISDFAAIAMLASVQRTAATLLDCGKQALSAGVDMEATSHDGYGDDLRRAIESGEVDISYLDNAVRRILSVKFRLGLFEDPCSKPEEIKQIHSDEAKNLARIAAEEGAVLLKNNGALPLSESFGKILLVGPNADVPQNGDYTCAAADDYTVTLRQALTEQFGEKIIYHKGCHVATDDKESLDAALRDAQCTDAVIVVLGDNSRSRGGIGWGEAESCGAVTCGEGFDSSSLELPPAQKKLLAEMKKTGKPVILVLYNGRPYCIGDECEMSDAVLEAWYPGEMGGYAVSNLLFGRVSPSGKLPITFPRNVGQLPCFYNYKISARGFYHKPGSYEKPGRDYVFDTTAPLFPFGYGLSYTTFEYSNLTVDAPDADNIKVSVKIKNTGNVRAKEAVLMYIAQKICPVTPFIRRLRRFTKIDLAPGEEQTVVFALDAQDVSYIGFDMKPCVGSGKFTVTVDSLSADFTL